MAEPPTLTILEIAAGTGMLGHGVRLALESIGLRAKTVCGIERESGAAAAFLAGMEAATGSGPPVWDDARTFASRRWRSGTGSVVDIICAGYPCQPFSYAGQRRGSRDARHLWPACRRIVARIKPSIVFFENVEGHVSMGLWKVLRDCERLGYRVTAGLFSAEEVGAPHLRKRAFILGVGDTFCDGRQPKTVSMQPWKQKQTSANASGTYTQLANAPISSKRAANWSKQGNDWARINGIGCPIFPPGQIDYQRWAELATGGLDPTEMPAIESGVPVVADGMAPPSDLLRLSGNGVVPLCAAWAFLNLFAALMEPVVDVESIGPLFAGKGIGE